MTSDQQTIDDYVRAFERHLAGTAADKARSRAELVEHLADAADAGDLGGALDRLGGPAAAAASFAEGRPTPAAAVGTRLVAALVDNLPLLGITIALLVQDLRQGGGFMAAFPPFIYAEVGGACVAVPPARCGGYEAGWLSAVGLPLAMAWSILGLGVIESRAGAGPGKRLLGLRVVTRSGLRVPLVTGVVRRSSFLLGPIAWVDWALMLRGDRRRILDHVVETKVVATVVGPRGATRDQRRPHRDPTEPSHPR